MSGSRRSPAATRRSAGAPHRTAATSRRTAAVSRRTAGTARPEPSLAARVEAALTWLERRATKRTRDGMARFGIPSTHALGVPVGTIRQLGRQLGRDHDLAGALWRTGCYEARLLAAFVGEPACVTATEMDRWCRDFDNWAVCDTVTFHLWDRAAPSLGRIAVWSKRRAEFERRAAFALLACVALRNREVADDDLARFLPLVERAAKDGRNFVGKAISWALRSLGRRGAALRDKCVALAERLAVSADAAERWVGKDALRDLARRPRSRSRP